MKNRSVAFTLIEVLIALFIIAIALSAAIRSTNQSIHTTTAVQNTMAAHWVAMNILSAFQTGQLHFSGVNTLDGKTLMLNRQWQWHADEELPVANIMQVTVTVFYQKHSINAVTGYVLQQ